MSELHLIAPGLAAWRDSPHSEPTPMPGLERLLARGRARSGETSLADALCQAFRVPRQDDSPLAPVTATYDGLNANRGYWLRADPVHLQVGMRGMTLLDATHVGLSELESEALAASLKPLFEEAGWYLLAPAPERWYGHPSHAVKLRTTPLDVVATRHVNSALPVGPSAARVMRLVNDAQIILHDHPVNQAREQRGQKPINSLWLWGGGEMPKTGRHFQQVLAEQTEALALARLSGSAGAPCPARLRDTPRADSTLLVLPEFPADATAADAARLDGEWFMPLLHGLHIGRFQRAGITLTGPEGGGVQLGILDAWKVWR
ncbi:MAG: hypothetical protein Q8Q28_02940 [Pseudomonadota bacterium]|nr:hypothetical protein [Pseudomonadota bacterium]